MSGEKWADSDWRFLRLIYFDTGTAAEFDSPDHELTGGVIRMDEKALRERIANLQAHGAATPEEDGALAAMTRGQEPTS